MMQQPLHTLEALSQRLDAWTRWVPYGLLAVSALLAALTNEGYGRSGLTWLLAALTAGWLWLMGLPALATPRWQPLTFVGLLALIALLVGRSNWFGTFIFTGYLYAWRWLRGPWRIIGVTATATISVIWQQGGPPPPTLAAWGMYGLLIGMLVALVVLFSATGEAMTLQNERRHEHIVALAEANARLELALRENAGLQAQVATQAREAGILDERQRLAAEIHDTLAQNLAGVIAQLVAAQQAPGAMGWRPYVEQALALARSNLAEARRSVQALRPESLERQALPEALSELCAAWADSHAVRIDFVACGDVRTLLEDLETTLYRVTQEALTNVARHARATRVGVTLAYLEDVVLLDVRDDGAGFDPQAPLAAAPGQRYGLRAMAQRLERVAGTLTLESQPGQGTALSACVPALAQE